MRRSLLSRAVGLVIQVLSLAALAPLAVLLVLPAAASADSCPNAIFRNGPSSQLPDCRAYEMVTPVYKEGLEVRPQAASEDGSRFFGESFGVFSGAESDDVNLHYFNNNTGEAISFGEFYLFSREESGWTTTAVGLPAAQYIAAKTFMFNPAMTESLSVAVPSAQRQAVKSVGRSTGGNYPSSFYVRSSNGPVAEVGPVARLSTSPAEEGYFFFAGASSDLSHIVFGLKEDFWPGDTTYPLEGGESIGQSLYEYVGTGNTAPMLVGVSGGPGSTSLISKCGTELGSQSYDVSPSGDAQGAVSSNGAVIYFTAMACAGSPPVSEIFARADSGQPDAHTVAISEPSNEDCSECKTEAGVLAGAKFIASSADGSKVFFTRRSRCWVRTLAITSMNITSMGKRVIGSCEHRVGTRSPVR
jgi:hypothetical protein